MPETQEVGSSIDYLRDIKNLEDQGLTDAQSHSIFPQKPQSR